MNLDVSTLAILAGIGVNILALVIYSNRHERRLTRVETIMSILASRAGINTRAHDDVFVSNKN